MHCLPFNCTSIAIIVIHHFLEFIFTFLFAPNWPQFVHFLCLKNSYHFLSKWQIASSAAIKTTTLHGKNAARWKTYKSIKSLSLLLCTLKYRSNHNNQFEHTLFTRSVYFFDLSLIARSLILFYIIRNYISWKFSKWMASFSLKRNVEKKWRGKKSHWHPYEPCRYTHWWWKSKWTNKTWNKIINEIGLCLKKKLDFLRLPFFAALLYNYDFLIPILLQWFSISPRLPFHSIHTDGDFSTMNKRDGALGSAERVWVSTKTEAMTL